MLFAMMVAIATVAAVAGDYQPRRLIQAGWGSGDAEFGLSLQAEGNCPQALAVADDSSLAILDAVNRRIQFYSPEGKWLGTFSIISNAFDLLFRDQELLVLAPYDHVAARYRREGQLIEKIAINPSIKMIDGLRAGENEVWLQTIEQAEFPLTKNQSQQVAAAQSGASARISGMRIRTQWIDPHQGEVIIENEKSGNARTVRIASQDELGSLVFLDTDLNGNIFVRKELFPAAGKPYFEVAKFDRNGTWLAAIRIDHENIMLPYRPIRVDKFGNVYFLEIKLEGFAVIQWQQR